MLGLFKKTEIPSADSALPGRDSEMPVAEAHVVLKTPMKPPFPDTMQVLYVGMGCFWGVERLFWKQPGIYTTAVGYAAGYTPNATYQEVCSGETGHNEVVLLVHDPSVFSLEQLLKLFWESHDPTQGMRQGNDTGTQYRSGIYTTTDAQLEQAEKSRALYQQRLSASGKGTITTEIQMAGPFYYAEDYHQQYLAKNPAGYCNLRGTGVCLES